MVEVYEGLKIMREKEPQQEQMRGREWLEKSKKGGITDEDSPCYDGKAGYDLLMSMASGATKDDIDVLMELAVSKDSTAVCRKRAIRSLLDPYWDEKCKSYTSYKYRDNKNVLKIVNLMRSISDDRDNEEDVRVLAYEKYRAYRHLMFGPLSKEELDWERELSITETSLQMQWLRYMRD